ncbi:MAG: prolyl oligopeptidase family serine peptidase [Deltaproteobacteria bacterium]|nr:prolyl oligopeptidase family serine peptidase [Deltaproteobacteria bacterium]
MVEKTIRRPWAFSGLLVGLLLLSSPAMAKKKPPKVAVAPGMETAAWLTLQPIEVALPAFHDAASGGFEAEDFLDSPLVPGQDLWPQDRAEVEVAGLPARRWKREAGEFFAVAPGEKPAVFYFATYISATRFISAQLEVTPFDHLKVFLDGEEVEVEAEGERLATGEVTLIPGKHLLLLKAVMMPSEEGETSPAVRARLVANDQTAAELAKDLGAALSFSTDPARPVRMGDFLTRKRVSGVDLSADGTWLAVRWHHAKAPPAKTESWIEIFEVASGRSVRTLRGGETGFTWAPSGDGFIYATTEESHSDLFFGELVSGQLRRVATKIEGFQELYWLPDGKSLIYVAQQESEADERGVKRFRGLRDRVSGYRDHAHLYQLSLDSGSRRRLTAGGDSIALEDISRDGSRVLFSTTPYDLRQQPFSRSDLYEMELASLEPRHISSVTWFGAATYQPGGEEILIQAGPSAFGVLGNALGEGATANNYDGQLYLLHRQSGETRPITVDFDPAVEQVAWAGRDRLILRAQQGSRVVPYRYDLTDGTFTALETGMEVVNGVSVSRQGDLLAAFGGSITEPLAVVSRAVFSEPVFSEPASSGRGGDAGEVKKLLPSSEEEADSSYVLGRVEDWSFEAAGGTVPGRIYYPPGFEAGSLAEGEKIPLIVYYYGGTVPTSRSWGSRWPWHLWASLGYAVYVPQPSGATGWGQEYSARHLNNWGRTTAQEIIQGTQELLDSRPHLDSDRVGCLGASYGGFMTMYLLTQTDLFSAAISHAGISSLSSYWGEGWWGYSYSSVASAGSYPWNNRELYLEQSPLFSADKINTPLLLLHGDADTNVPIGESQQMYTALEILERDVEFVTFEGENHRIVGAEHQEIWVQTILAWFEWKLKGQPEWWQEIYGDQDDPKG